MNQKNKKRIIVVLGMHRGGTSAITRGLNVLGVNLGDNLMPAIPGNNPTGFWEDMDIYHFNEKLLKKLKSNWQGIGILDKGVLLNSQFQSEHDGAVKLLKEKFRPSDCFGFKDPRTAVLLPFWQKVFAKLKLEDCYLISLRNPLSVAESLSRRDGLDLEKSFLLWIKHFIVALRNSEGKKRVIVDYDLLLNSPRAQLERVSKALKLPSPNKQRKEVGEYTRDFLTKDLRHNTANISDLKKNKTIPPFVRSAYFWLSKLARDEVKFGSSAFKKAWRNIEETYQEFSAVYGYFDRLDLERKQLNATLEQSHAEREQLKAENVRQISDLNQGVAERDGRISDLNQGVAERDGRISDLNQTVAERDRQIASLNLVVAERDGSLAEMCSSRSWRFTAPLRWAVKQIRYACGLRPTPLGQSDKIYKEIELTALQNSNFGTSAMLNIAGWCFSQLSKDPLEIEVRLNETPISSIVCDGERLDVQSQFDESLTKTSSIPHCGFHKQIYLDQSTGIVELTCKQLGEVISKIDLESLRKESGAESDSNSVSAEAFNNSNLLSRIFTKARKVVNRKNFYSLSKWLHWLKQAKQELILHNLENKPVPRIAVLEKLKVGEVYVKNNSIQPNLRELLTTGLKNFSYQPLISIIMPVYNVAPKLLIAAVESVRNQIYPHWELCIADDASTRRETVDTLKTFADDARIKIEYRKENGHICKASNSAADRAEGEFIALMDNDDLITPHALFEIVRLLQDHPSADLIYSDEDKVDAKGKEHYDLHFKPDWSPTLLLGYNYINHLTCIRRSVFEEVGRFRPGYEGAQDYDLLLRVTEKTQNVHHISKILYHWRGISESTAADPKVKPVVKRSALSALEEHLKREKIEAVTYQPEFAKIHDHPIYQLNWPDKGPLVEIIIPTYNQKNVLFNCIESIKEKTDYKNYHIMVVNNDSDDPATIEYLDSIEKNGIRVEAISSEGRGFSFSRINNQAVGLSDADYVLLLNNDTEVLEPKWLSRMVGYLQLPNVGAVGSRLLYPDGSIQHAGVQLGMKSFLLPDHQFRHHPKDFISYFFLAETARECTAVTAACMLTPRNLFLELGGFDEKRFALSLNDVDYCLRLRKKNLNSLYVPGAELLHYESASRDKLDDDPAEFADFRKKHGGEIDEFYNINLSNWKSYALTPQSKLDYIEYLERPLRLTFFNHNFDFGGAQRVLLDIAHEVDREKIKSTLVAPHDGPLKKEAEDLGLECEVINVFEGDNILAGWASESDFNKSLEATVKYLKKEKPDLVVVNVINMFFVVEAAWHLNIPCLWLIHESYDRQLIERNINSFALPILEEAFSKAYGVIFVSTDTSNMYQQYNTNCNFTVINNSYELKMDALKGAEQKQLLRKKIKTPAGKKIILSVGTVCERKDQATLVKAVSLLSEKRDDFICYLVGGKEKDNYSYFIQELIDRGNIGSFVKVIPETKEVADYYNTADIFAFTSVNESYSLVILEAMAYGLPIVTTNCSGINEQVLFGVNALAFNFGDSKMLATLIGFLLDNEEKRNKLGINSRKLFEAMQNKKEMIHKYERLIYSAFQVGLPKGKGAHV